MSDKTLAKVVAYLSLLLGLGAIVGFTVLFLMGHLLLGACLPLAWFAYTVYFFPADTMNSLDEYGKYFRARFSRAFTWMTGGKLD